MCMVHHVSSEGINDLIIKLNNAMEMNYRPPRYYSIDEEIYATEIHLLVAICERPLCNVSQLAEYFGVTKSMISKTAGKLERKGLLRKMRTLQNGKEVFFALTAKGQQAYADHKSFHDEWDHNKWTGYESLPEHDKDVIANFIVNYTSYMAEMGGTLKIEAAEKAKKKQ